MNSDKLIIGGHEFDSRFILGSGKYSLNLIKAAIEYAGAQIITLAVRRANTKEGENILPWDGLGEYGERMFAGPYRFVVKVKTPDSRELAKEKKK